MRELNGRRDMLGELRLLGMAAALAVSTLAVMACASVPAQATDPTSTPTATPAATGEEQAAAELTHTPTATATPTDSGQRDFGSDPEATSTPTPTPTPAPLEEQTADPAVTSTLDVVAGPPLGDCFGDALYVSISQPRVTADMVRFALEQSYAFYDAWPRLVYHVGYGCSETVEPWPDCYLKAVGGWYDGGYLLLPQTIAHEAIVMLVTGGETGRRKTPSWASWRQLWPRAGAHEGTGTRANGGGPAFDVSDVDVTNFPEVDCGSSVSSNSCRWWKDFPEVGIAGAHGGGGIGYFQIKNPPTDEAELKALKHRLMPCPDVIGNCTYTDDSGPTCTVARYTLNNPSARLNFLCVEL